MLRVTQLSGFGIGSGGITIGRVLANSGSYAVVGNAAGVVKFSPAAKTLTAAAASYLLTGTAAIPTVGFTPSNLTGLIGWWDTSITASITLSGSSVQALADQSGGGNHLGNGGLGRTLPYSATGFNTSYPGITATGSALTFLETPSAFPMGTGNELTAWHVGTIPTGGSTAFPRVMSYTHGGVNDNLNAGSWLVYAPSTTELRFHRNGLETAKTGISASPAGHRCIYTIDSSGVMTIYVDGVASSTVTSAGNWISGGTGSFDLFRQAQHEMDHASVTISEAGVATGFSDATTVGKLDTYLKNKWGL